MFKPLKGKDNYFDSWISMTKDHPKNMCINYTLEWSFIVFIQRQINCFTLILIHII